MKDDYINKLEGNYEKALEEVKGVRKLYNESQNNINELWAMNKKLATNLKDQEALNHKFNTELEVIRPKLDTLVPENKELKKAIEDAKLKIHNLTKNNNDLKHRQEMMKLQYENRIEEILTNNRGRQNIDGFKVNYKIIS